jgi:hypothetical protein
MAAGETTATALAELHYARIESQNGEINSFLALSRGRAMTQAAKIDGMAAKTEALPALAGVPVGIKDVLVMRGAPATAGSLILKGYRPPYDATAVTRLEAAGAVERRRLSRQILRWRRLGPILVGQFDSRPLFVGWLGCCRRMDGSADMG